MINIITSLPNPIAFQPTCQQVNEGWPLLAALVNQTMWEKGRQSLLLFALSPLSLLLLWHELRSIKFQRSRSGSYCANTSTSVLSVHFSSVLQISPHNSVSASQPGMAPTILFLDSTHGSINALSCMTCKIPLPSGLDSLLNSVHQFPHSGVMRSVSQDPSQTYSPKNNLDHQANFICHLNSILPKEARG